MKQIRHKLLTRGLSLLLAGALAGSCSVEEKAVTGVRFSIGGVSSQESETRSAAIDSLASQNDSIAPVILALGDSIALECELREEAESLLKATTTAFSNGHKFRIISTRGSTVEDKGEFAAGSGDIHLTGLTSGTYTFSTYSYNNTSSLPSPSSNLIDNISPNQDLLYWHSGNINISANSSTSCNIVFKHLFPQVQVVVNAKDKNSSNGLIISALSAKLTPGKYARMDVTDGSLSAGTSGDFQQSLTWNNMNTSSLTSDFRSVYTNTAGAVNLVFDMASVTVDGTAYTGKTVTFNNVTLTPGKRYTMTVNINKDNAGAISSLGCSSVTGVYVSTIKSLTVSKSLPYTKTGGNVSLTNGKSLGSAYGLTVSVNGAQTLSTASGNIKIKITGKATTIGTLYIPITVEGVSCSLRVNSGKCGAFISMSTWRNFMCHNQGADESLDPFTPAAGLHGAKYRWGTKDASYTMAQDQNNSGDISGWSSFAVQTSNVDWDMTANNPCPAGWRVPTRAEWEGVINPSYNRQTGVGTFSTWNKDHTNFTSGLKFGDYLFLPTAGWRWYHTGSLTSRGQKGFYWSSAAPGNETIAGMVNFGEAGSATYSGAVRTYGMSVRCIAE